MTNRERFLNAATGKPVDRGVLWQDKFWDDTLKRWLREGMPDGFDFGCDFIETDAHDCLPVSYGYHPGFVYTVHGEAGGRQLVTDTYGVKKYVMKNNPGLQQFIEYPVKCRKDWEVLKHRLDADAPGRFAEGWAETAKAAADSERVPVTLGGGHLCGFFSFLRETMGDGCYYFFFDDEDLIRDMLNFQKNRICAFIKKTTASVKVDRLFIWEDMCYKNGPLISPEMFRTFLFDHYREVADTARSRGIEVIDLDSDGNINELLPLWTEAGVNMLHPLEVQAGMDVAEIRRRFGYGFAMRGGVDKRMLALGKKEIDKELERIRPVYEEGRYIPCADHSVPPDVSYYNYLYYQDGLKKLLGI